MRKKMFLLACVFVLSLFAGCSSSSDTDSSDNEQASSEDSAVVSEVATEENKEDVEIEDSEVAADDDEEVSEVEDKGNTRIVLKGNSISVDGAGATVEGSKVTIVSAGTYSISGSLSDGQILVNTEDEDIVTLIFNGVDIRNSVGAPIYVMNAEETAILLAEHTENYVSDGASYIFEDPETDEPNAAIFSKDDLTVYGKGSLTVKGNFNDGIASKDGLIIENGTLTVNSLDDGIRGKDYLIVKDGNIAVNAGGDGLKSDNEEDVEKGYISVEKGMISITSGGDAIQAQSDVKIGYGEFTLSSGGGSSAAFDENTSAKGVKAVANIIVEGGTFDINSADDAVHSNGSINIQDGIFYISSGDDGIHADSSIEISGGDIAISKSYEGIESAVITINDGDIRIVSSDDGLNISGGNDGSGIDGRPGQGGFAPTGNYWLYINGGYIAIDALGDGIDANGSVVMSDGLVIVNGPTADMNGALDHVSFEISGGFLVAAGSSGMAQAPGTSSTQNSLLLNFSSVQQAGSLIHIQDSDGKGILTFAPSKRYQSVAFSSPELISGAAYTVYTGGSSSATVNDGLYSSGTYTPGTRYTGFTVSGVVTKLGSGGGMFGR